MQEIIPENYNEFVTTERDKIRTDEEYESCFFDPKNGKLYDKDEGYTIGIVLLGIWDDSWYPVYSEDNIYLGYYNADSYLDVQEAFEFWR